METTAKRIRKYREALDYSQEFMASKLGISQPAFAKIENGTTKVNIEKLLNIAKILNVEPYKLLEDSKTINQINNDYAYGFVENLYQDNKETTQKLLNQLESENKRLCIENERLLKLVVKNNESSPTTLFFN